MKLIHKILFTFLIIGLIGMWAVIIMYDSFWGITAMAPWAIWILIMDKVEEFAAQEKAE